jgi:hypothetical protein
MRHRMQPAEANRGPWRLCRPRWHQAAQFDRKDRTLPGEGDLERHASNRGRGSDAPGHDRSVKRSIRRLPLSDRETPSSIVRPHTWTWHGITGLGTRAAMRRREERLRTDHEIAWDAVRGSRDLFPWRDDRDRVGEFAEEVVPGPGQSMCSGCRDGGDPGVVGESPGCARGLRLPRAPSGFGCAPSARG